MRKHLRTTYLLVIILSLLLGACAAAPANAGKASGQAAPAATNQPSSTEQPAAAAAATSELSSQQVLSLFVNLMNNIPAGKGYGYIQPDALKADQQLNQKLFIIDVRDSSEIAQTGFIQGAVNIPLRSLLKDMTLLPAQNTQIVVYSNSGYRGGMALAALMLLGYTDVHDLSGGFSNWATTLKYPIVTGSVPASPQAVTSQPVISDQALYDTLNSYLSNLPDDYYQITPLDLSKQVTSSNPLTLVDINTSSDHAQYGTIKGAIFIPFSTFFNNVNQLPNNNTPIVIYSDGGGHSSILVMGLRLMGYTNVLNLKGGIIGWKNTSLPVQPGG